MTPKFEGQELTLSFSNGLSKRWLLPNQDDKQSLAKIRAEMLDFAKQQNDATPGQLQAITKALNGAGYYITGPRPR